jgi:hypothetical protein
MSNVNKYWPEYTKSDEVSVSSLGERDERGHQIRKALLDLCEACGLPSFGVFCVLLEASLRVKYCDYEMIGRKSYEEALCYDVTGLIAGRIMEVMGEADAWEDDPSNLN